MKKPVGAGASAAPTGFYKLLLLAATLLWGASFTVLKGSFDVFQPATVIGLRFGIAAVLLFVIFFRRIMRNLSRETVVLGALLGVIYFLGYWVQTIGLTDTTPGKNAFLTASYVVMVPFVFWLVGRRRPTRLNVLAAVACLVGIGLVSLNEYLQLGFGDAMTLLCALFYALHIACLGRFAQGRDIFALTFLQFSVCGVLGLGIGVSTEQMPTMAAVLDPTALWQLGYLAIGATFLACTFQNVGQTRVAPSQASLIMSLESVFGVLFSIALYGETLTLQVLAGFVLIFIAIVSSEILATKEFKWRKRTT